MNNKLIIAIITAIIIVSVTGQAFAGVYFGFELGVDKQPTVTQKLKAGSGRYDTGYSYKGSGSVPSIKVFEFNRFAKLGRIKEAWLSFQPSGVLYEIQVTWYDSGKIYTTVKDGLSAKYTSEGSSGFGFNSSDKYRDGTTYIELKRNTFGFGDDQTTTLIYTHIPSVGAVKAAKAAVEEAIRRRNAERTGGDL